MKKLIIILSGIILFYSCSQEKIEENEPEPSYLGEYHTGNADTTFVSQNGMFTKFEWAPKHHNGRLTFDSVVVNSDLTFTDNEWVTRRIYTPPYSEEIKNIGSGSFGQNSIQFTFILDGGTINFSGIKAN